MLFSADGYQKAINYAADKHGNQKIPGSNLPYVVHLSLVAMEVALAIESDAGLDGSLAIQCALLHDTIEDTSAKYSDILHNFGQKVADGVLALTKNSDLEKSSQLSDSLERILKQPKEIQIVKLADRITNLQAPPEYWSYEKRVHYRKEATYILKQLGEASNLLAQRLSLKIEAYAEFLKR